MPASADLPIRDIADAIVSGLRVHRRLVLSAPTGSGKSTQVPRMLLDAGLAGSGQIVTLQPRRLAARMLASRVASEMGVPLGGKVGYRVRLDNRAGPDTRILFETEGILLRRMTGDPNLEGIQAVIFDEFHERHLYGDITLARVLDLQETTRPDLQIVVMSATLDSDALARYLDPAMVLTSDGRTFPVEIEYRATPVPRGQRPVPAWEQAAEAFVREARGGISGNVLIFMPGAYEIHRTIDAIGRRPESKGFRLAPLHGQLPPAEQDAAVDPDSGPRIVVASNVAETSITIDGVTLVIDSGLARILRYDPHRGINTLLVESISQASADQRAGRAGRTGPGRAIRLWSESDQRGRPTATPPEVQRLDLSEAVLTLKAAGMTHLDRFRWLDAPPTAALEHAETLLEALGAIEPGNDAGITDMGRRMLAFPVHPRYARMLVAADQHGCVPDACRIAALTQGRDMLIRNPGPDVLDARRERFGSEATSDFWTLMRAWDYAASERFRVDRLAPLGIHAGAAREAGLLYEQFLAIARDQGLDVSARETRFESLRRCVLTGFSDRVGRRLDPGGPRAVLVGQRKGVIDTNSLVQVPLFVAAEIREIGPRKGEVETSVSLLTAIEPEWLRGMYPDDLVESVDVWLDSVTRRVRAERRIRFRDLVLESTPSEVPPDGAARVLSDEVMADRMTLPLWDHAVVQWIRRLNLLVRACPELGLPPLGDPDRRAIVEQLCYGASGYKDLKDRPVLPVVRSWLSPLQQELVATHAPERVRLSNGKTPKLLYEEDQVPSFALRIQELFDVVRMPTIAMGRVTPKIQILAPNMRPVQVTTDLAGFWRHHYPEIKPALSRRYPKHEWR